MASGLSAVRSSVAAAAHRSGRDPGEITLVAVSKEATDAEVLACLDAGVVDFGENRADDLSQRVSTLPAGIRWHFIGRLQSNKVRSVRPVTNLLHSLDRPALVDAWVKGPGTPPPVLVQVNVSGEPQKAGVRAAEAKPLIAYAESLGLEVRGLMTMAALHRDPEASRPAFTELRSLRDTLRESFPSVTELSMGMSGDFEVAISEGATVLRVGRAIFGLSRHEG